jgi:mono/diheme cytochrome c family protein
VAGLAVLIFIFGAMWGFSHSGDVPYDRSDNYSENRTYPGRGMYPGREMYPAGEIYPERTSVSYNISDFESNGEMIYYTGFNESGEIIEIEYGPRWLYVHGGSCVDCHGADGRGGYRVMMSSEIPPDIRYESLVSGEHEVDEVDDEHLPFTKETIKRAIRDGIDPAGEPLDLTMPRWKMIDKDVDDVVEYLKTL